jgi:hypothetical protein
MNDNDLEGRLRRESGPRERGYVPGQLPATIAEAAAPRRPSSIGRAVLLAGAVVAGAAVALVLTRGPAPAQNGVGSAGTASPTATAVASPTEPDHVACVAEDFAWSTDPWTGAAGSRGTNVLLRGVTSLAGCRIDGTASLTLRDSHGETVLSGVSAPSHQSVTAGMVLEIGISWSNWCGDDLAAPLTMSLMLPGDDTTVPLVPAAGNEVAIPPCNGEGQASVLNGTDIQASERIFPDG